MGMDKIQFSFVEKELLLFFKYSSNNCCNNDKLYRYK